MEPASDAVSGRLKRRKGAGIPAPSPIADAMRSPKNFVGGEPGAPGSPSARRRLRLGRPTRLVGSARFHLCGGARLHLGARQLVDEAVGLVPRALIEFGHAHIDELAIPADDASAALDHLYRAASHPLPASNYS